MLPKRGGLHAWETLGHGVTGLESLESRVLMAADLAVTLDDNMVADVVRSYYQPGSQITYTLKVTNSGDADATGARLTTSLAGGITQATWTAAYSTDASGSLSYDDAGTPRTVPNVRAGTGDLDIVLNIPRDGSATFTIVATVGRAATGDLVSSATIDLDGDPSTTTDRSQATDTDTFVPKSIVVSDDAGWTSTSLVRLVDPATGGPLASAYAFEAGFKTGVRSAMGDLDADGKAEIVCVPSYGRVAEIVVFRQDIGVGGSVTLVKDTSYNLRPFGSDYRRGLNVVVADFTGDGRDDVAVAKSSGSGDVKIYESNPAGPEKLVQLSSFTPSGVGAINGVSLAAGDFGTFVDGVAVASAGLDGKCELVVASRAGAAPVVQVYDASDANPVLIDTIRPFSSSFVGGLAVTVARIDRNSIPDIIVSQGRGGGSEVEVYDGRLGAGTNPLIARFAAFADLATSSAPVFAAAVDTDGDGRANSIDVVQGGAGRAAMRRYLVNTLVNNDGTPGPITISRDNASLNIAGRLRVAAAAARNDVNIVTTDSGLQYRDLVSGSGATLSGKRVNVDYTGSYNFLAGSLASKVFDSSKVAKAADPTSPKTFAFTVGAGSVIKGWDEGVASMKIGGSRQLIIPAGRLGYYSANSTEANPLHLKPLTFEVKAISLVTP